MPVMKAECVLAGPDLPARLAAPSHTDGFPESHSPFPAAVTRRGGEEEVWVAGCCHTTRLWH